MEHFQATLDPRKQELLEARFLGARVSCLIAHTHARPFSSIRLSSAKIILLSLPSSIADIDVEKSFDFVRNNGN